VRVIGGVFERLQRSTVDDRDGRGVIAAADALEPVEDRLLVGVDVEENAVDHRRLPNEDEITLRRTIDAPLAIANGVAGQTGDPRIACAGDATKQSRAEHVRAAGQVLQAATPLLCDKRLNYVAPRRGVALNELLGMIGLSPPSESPGNPLITASSARTRPSPGIHE
jgi:hypothetical protein